MKSRKTIYNVLTVILYALAINSFMLFIGSIGAFECCRISFGRFLVQELIAVIECFAAIGVYNYRSYYKPTRRSNSF